MLLPALNTVTLDNIQSLIDNRVIESKFIEYKKDFSSSDASNGKFNSEICAFANTSGGDIIFGIDEDADGYPTEIIGIEIASIDTKIQLINNIIRTGLEPRIPTPEIEFIEIENNHYLIIIRISQSWNAPHRVIKNNHFYGRNSSGKFAFDVSEIKTAVISSDSLADKIRNFKYKRLLQIESNSTYRPMDEGAKLAIHLIPLPTFTDESAISISENEEMLTNFVPILADRGRSFQINLDGHICYRGGILNNSKSYTQVYRNGAVEACYSFDNDYTESRTVHMTLLQNQIVDKIRLYCELLNQMNIRFPMVLFISFTGFKGYRIDYDRHMVDQNLPFENSNILLPEVVINEQSDDLELALKPAFDVFYNAFGFAESFNYSD